MAKVSQEIRDAWADGRWDERAQRAATLADMAPLLLDACNDTAYALARRRMNPEGLRTALTLCEDVARAVYQALGYQRAGYSDETGLEAGDAFGERIGLSKALKEKAVAAAGNLLNEDDSAIYKVRG